MPFYKKKLHIIKTIFSEIYYIIIMFRSIFIMHFAAISKSTLSASESTSNDDVSLDFDVTIDEKK